MSLQSRIYSFFAQHWGALVVIAVGGALQLFLATRSIEFLLGNVLPDDAFYYFEIARNLSLGLGSTFDGITQTNGYHPLWMIILWPLYGLTNTFGFDAIAPIRIALFISIALNLGTGWVVYRILSRFSSHTFIVYFGLMVFILNPFLLYELINGLETSLALFLLSLFFLQALIIPTAPSPRAYLLLGVLGGLTILARLDLLFYVAAVGAWVFYQDTLKRQYINTLYTGGVVAVLVLPFLTWNFFTYGTFLTSASGANELVNHALIVQDNGSGAYQTVKAVFYNLHGQLRDLMIHTGAPEITIGFIGAFILLLALGIVQVPKTLRQVKPIHVFAAGFALLFLLNVAVRFTARTWYFVSFGVLFAVAVVVVLHIVRERSSLSSRARQIAFALLASFVLSSFFIWWHKELRESMALQREMYAAAEWFNAHVPPDTVIGVFNAGVQGYFTHARVVNLDGLVNNEAYRAMKTQTLWEYIKEAHIAYLSDFDIYIDYRYRSFYGVESLRPHLEHVTNLQLVRSNKSDHGISIYKVVP